MTKKVYDFKKEYLSSNCMGNRWRGFGYVKGCSYFVECIFFGCGKKEIEKTLKDLIRKKAQERGE